MTTAITFNQDSPEAEQSPLYMTEGEERILACTFWGVPSSVSFLAYRSTSETGNGISATIFNAGSATVSGNTATLPTIGDTYPLTGRATYIVNVTATVDSEVYVKYIKIRVRKDEAMA
jgi:hypothetical protein